MYQIQLVGANNTYEDIYNQSRVNELPAIGPRSSYEINEAGSLSFTLVYTHPMYNTLEPMAHYVRALDDGEEIFYGRILQRSEPTLSGQVTFQCEGALSFLLDSEIAPYGKDQNGNQITRHLTAQQFFEACIQEHNAFVNDPRRQFTVGIVNASKRATEDDYSITSFTQTKNAIETQLLGIYGGFIRVRPNGSGGHYIDWIENYETVNPQAITVGTNLEEQTNEKDGSSMFTVLRPIGKDDLQLTEKTIDLYSQEDMAKYGRIVKTVNFNSAETEADLRAQANEYKDRTQKTLFINSNVQLVDMHYIDGTSPKIKIGDRFTNLYGLEGIEMVASSLDLDFENPENDSVAFKNRKSLDPDLTPEGNGHGGARSMTRSSSKSKSQTFKYLREVGTTLEVLAPQVYMHGQELIAQYESIQINAGDIRTTANNLETLSRTTDQEIQAITHNIDGIEYRVEQIEGTGVVQNWQTVSTVAGSFEIWTDSQGKKTVHLKNGAEMAVDSENGGTITVGEEIQRVKTTANGNSTFINTLQGSALWTQRENITGVCGEYEVQEERVPDVDHPGQFITRKTLVIKSGGGMQIKKDGVEYGVYMTPENAFTAITIPSGSSGVNPKNNCWWEKSGDAYIRTNDVTVQSGKTYYSRATAGNTVLTGGLIVQQINGQSVTSIKGSKILVGDDLNADDLPTWAQDAEGLIASKATIQQLNAQKARIDDIEASYINVDNLQAALASVSGRLTVGNSREGINSGLKVLGTMDLNGAYVNVTDAHIMASGSSGPGTGNSYSWNKVIVQASVSGNTLTLQPLVGDPITFSKATSLSGSWSGGTLTVTAKQNYVSVGSFSRNITWKSPYKNDNGQWKAKVVAEIPGTGNPPEYDEIGEMNLYLYLASKTGSNKITSNGTYTPSGTVMGYTSVEVDVPNKTPISGTAGGPSYSGSQAHVFTITSADGTTRNLTINCGTIYSTARSGYYTQAQYDSYGSSRYNDGWDEHLNHTYAWFEMSDSPCEQNYGMTAGKYFRIFYIGSDGVRRIGKDSVNGVMKEISWGPVPQSGSAGTISIPDGNVNTSDNPTSTYNEHGKMGRFAHRAYDDYEWLIFKVSCTCGASRYYKINPRASY